MIDLHCHILPGLDDGAKDWDESLQMAQIASLDGISGIVCTPHHSPAYPENSREAVMASVEQLRTKLRESGIGIEVYPGCELAIEFDLPERIGTGELLAINDNRKIALVEMAVEFIPPNLSRFFWMMQSSGVDTILAHPERNHLLMKDPSKLSEWVQAGVMVQITASSLTGHYGRKARDFSLKLLRHRMVHFVASDSHGCERRRPVLSKARSIIEGCLGTEEALRILYEYPAQILRGEVPDIAGPIPLNGKKSLIRRILGMGDG